jgi:Arc/MetJ family transcription regulator
LKPSSLLTAEALQTLKSLSTEEQKTRVHDLFRSAIGEQPSAVLNLKAPHAASTTRDRAAAAADVAVAAKELGVVFVLKECGLLQEIQRILFPQGIEVILGKSADGELSTLKPSISALSLASLGEDSSTGITGMTDLTIGTDSKRGKTTPPNAREGCLLVIRGLCQMVGQKAEPFVVGAFLAAALDECASTVSAVREAAEDTTSALVTLANPWAFNPVIAPLLLNSLASSEWRVKAIALERLQQCTVTSPQQVRILIPTLIPAVTNQVWDTKAQVSKAARGCLQAICDTNNNADIRPAIPAIVNAICKPADTNKAVSELMGTTFVVPVNASTLAILCPVLARALKERLAIHKRAACIVITNMGKLVETKQAIAPFGSLLVPELKKVSQNVQFEEIRDEALRALASLTKALGDAYVDSEAAEQPSKEELKRETSLAEAEQERIRQAREAEMRREEEIRKKEEEERKKFKEAMDAQRELDKLSAAAALKKKQEEEQIREKQKLSTKSASGVCQGCGLKKCKATCLFNAK